MTGRFPPVLTTEQMRRFDREATARSGLPSLILMENAGRGVAEAVRLRCPPPAAVASADGSATRPVFRRVVVILCGGGNNGGDGFVVARHLSASSDEIRVVLAAPRAKVAGDASTLPAASRARPASARPDRT